MVIWGAIWGGVLGLLWPGYDWEWQAVVGVLLGALAGRMLRGALRREIEAAVQQRAPAAVFEPKQGPARVEPAPVAIEKVASVVTPADFEDTAPAGQAAPLPRPAPISAPTSAATPAAPPGWPAVLAASARNWLLGGNTIVRMGVLVLFVGLAFLAKYAAENSLLPPELRLAAIGAAGIGLFVAGLRLRRRASAERVGYALTLQGAGVAVLYLTVFAAFRLYQFLPAGLAFVVLAAICAFSTVIALAQNAQALAFIGFAGAFAAPLLVSTGQGSHVSLFSYYLLLGVAIAAIAWARAWRPLNLLGFFATFGVASAWGVLRWRPEDYASTQPFLIGFFLVYVAATVLYATRHALAARRAVDATLVFGVPLVGFGLQAGLVRGMPFGAALSALAVGAFYLGLGTWMARRGRAGHLPSRWLAECFAALGLGFVTLAVPLALDARWTTAVWAVEGAGVYWMGRRQGRWLARAAGLALQAFAAASFLAGGHSSVAAWPLAHPGFIGALMLAGAALAIAWWSRDVAAPDDASPWGTRFAGLEHRLSPWLFWLGFVWWQFALGSEIGRLRFGVSGGIEPAYSQALRLHLGLMAWVGSAFALQHLALPARARPWPVAATPAWTVLPLLLVGATVGAAAHDHVFADGGWLAWPVLLVLHALMLRRLDAGAPAGWWPWVHAGGVWLAVLLAGNLLAFAVGRAQLWQTAWAAVVLLVAGTAVVLALSRQAWYDTPRRRWPLDRFARAYLWTAAAPLVAAVAAGALVVSVASNGDARPLPYLPLLNPTDLSVGLALAACALWLLRLRRSALPLPAAAREPAWGVALAAIGFVAINTVWLRVAHHYAQVPWDAGRLFDSFLVQAGYSILWTLLALGVMVAAHRRAWRTGWMAGAGLLGLTVLKLFLVDLSNRGGSERIVVFIAVGVLMLLVGYVAPLPPARPAVREATS